MNRLLFIAIALAGWILFTVANRGFFLHKISAMPSKTLNNTNSSSVPTIQQNLGLKGNLQNQIQSELYSSISIGMSYAEVSSILGWPGILIYQNNVDDGGETIQTKVYRWNDNEAYLDNTTDYESINKVKISSNENLILKFQNDILIEIDSGRNLY